MRDGLLPELGYWLHVKDGEARAYALMTRHYSFHAYKDGRRQNRSNPNRHLFCGPGEKMILLGADEQALFVWRKFIDKSGQTGVNCAVFRNESGRKASDLIREAEQIAWARWPGERLYTYVNAQAVTSEVPGYCFRRAGWKHCGETQAAKLMIFEKYPKAMVSDA
jgi:hypothetical protein